MAFLAQVMATVGPPAHNRTVDDSARAAVAVGSLPTPVGQLAVAVSARGLAGVGWRDPAGLLADRPRLPGDDRLTDVLDQLAAYFRGERRGFDFALDLSGLSLARRAVLETLFETVPFGASITYGELAHRSSTGVPARGIGSIMGANPIPIVVPCHRVLASTGLGGYSGGRSGTGLETKRWLLTLEGVLQPPLGWGD